MKDKQLLVLVEPEQHAWVKEEAERSGEHMADVVRRLIDFASDTDAVFVLNRYNEDGVLTAVEEVLMDPRQTGALGKLAEYKATKGDKRRMKKRPPAVVVVEKPLNFDGMVPRHTKSEAWAGYPPSGKRLTENPIQHHLAVKEARRVCLEERRMTCIYIDGKLDRVFSYRKGKIEMRRF